MKEIIMSDEIIANLGPLAALAGVWESDQGVDTSRIHGKKNHNKISWKNNIWANGAS